MEEWGVSMIKIHCIKFSSVVVNGILLLLQGLLKNQVPVNSLVKLHMFVIPATLNSNMRREFDASLGDLMRP